MRNEADDLKCILLALFLQQPQSPLRNGGSSASLTITDEFLVRAPNPDRIAVSMYRDQMRAETIIELTVLSEHDFQQSLADKVLDAVGEQLQLERREP